MGLLATIFLAMGSRGVLSEATGQSLKPLMPTQITKNSEEWNSVTILQAMGSRVALSATTGQPLEPPP